MVLRSKLITLMTELMAYYVGILFKNCYHNLLWTISWYVTFVSYVQRWKLNSYDFLLILGNCSKSIYMLFCCAWYVNPLNVPVIAFEDFFPFPEIEFTQPFPLFFLSFSPFLFSLLFPLLLLYLPLSFSLFFSPLIPLPFSSHFPLLSCVFPFSFPSPFSPLSWAPSPLNPFSLSLNWLSRRTARGHQRPFKALRGMSGLQCSPGHERPVDALRGMNDP